MLQGEVMEGPGVVVFFLCPPPHFGDRVAVSIHAISRGALRDALLGPYPVSHPLTAFWPHSLAEVLLSSLSESFPLRFQFNNFIAAAAATKASLSPPGEISLGAIHM